MLDDSSIRLAVFFFAGLGLLLTGIANILLRNKAEGYRAAATLLFLVLAGSGIGAFTENASAVATTLLFLVCVLALAAAAGSNRLAAKLAKIANAVRNPVARWGFLGLAGLALAAGAVTYQDGETNAELDRETAELELLTAPPVTAFFTAVNAMTDRGTPVSIREATSPREDAELKAIEELVMKSRSVRNGVIRQHPATDRSNCHGWVFTAGRFWLPGENIDRILTENDYALVTDPKPGDLIVYRKGTSVTHTALVRYVTEGYPVLVEGKWGCTGVYLHEAERSIYGSNFTYYRSSRQGHLLAGLVLPPPSSDAATQPRTIVPNLDNPDEFTE